MKQRTISVVCAAAAIWLSAFGFVELPCRAAADDNDAKQAEAQKNGEPKDLPKADKAKAKPKDDKAKAKPKADKAKAKNGISAAFGALVNDAVRALAGGGKAKPNDPDIPANDPIIKQFEQQYAGRFRQLHRTELHFIRLVCQPTKLQYQKIATDGENALKSTLRTFAVAQYKMRHGRFRAGEQRSQPHDPRKLIAEGLMQLVKETLSAEQATLYQNELDRRSAARKRVALLNIVAKLDKKLVLTAEQRSKLSETLNANWKNSWNQMQMLMYGDQYVPQLPDHNVLPILNNTQKDVWRQMAKQGNVFFGFNMGLVQGIEIEEEVWDEKQPVELQERVEGKAAANKDSKTEDKK